MHMRITSQLKNFCYESRGVETILKVEGHDSYEVKNGGPGVYPRKKFCKPRPSNCGKMIPRLVIMLKPNKIPPLKLYIAITFCLITFLLKSPQWNNEIDKHLNPKGLLWTRNL